MVTTFERLDPNRLIFFKMGFLMKREINIKVVEGKEDYDEGLCCFLG